MVEQVCSFIKFGTKSGFRATSSLLARDRPEQLAYHSIGIQSGFYTWHVQESPQGSVYHECSIHFWIEVFKTARGSINQETASDHSGGHGFCL